MRLIIFHPLRKQSVLRFVLTGPSVWSHTPVTTGTLATEETKEPVGLVAANIYEIKWQGTTISLCNKNRTVHSHLPVFCFMKWQCSPLILLCYQKLNDNDHRCKGKDRLSVRQTGKLIWIWDDHTHGIFVLVPQFLLKGLVSGFWRCILQGHLHWAWFG